MRNVIRIYSILILLFLLPVLSLKAQTQKLYLNPATAGAAAQSKFIDITRFTPLIAPSDKIDMNSGLYITKQYWILYNYADKKLMIFSKQGQLLKSLSLKKYGDAALFYDSKNELLKFNIRNKNYTLITKDLVKIRSNPQKSSYQKYFKNYQVDLKDPSLEIKKTATDPYFIVNAKWYYDDFYYLSDLNPDVKASDTLGYELQILKDYKPVKSFFSFNRKANNVFKYAGVNSNLGLFKTDSPHIRYFSRLFIPTIYKLEKDSIIPQYEIILPVENAMPQQYFKNGFKSESDWQNFRNSNGAAFHSVGDFQDSKPYLFLGIRLMRSYEGFLYDKKTGKFYKTKMIKADSSQYNIQLLQNGMGVYDNGSYYAMVPAKDFVDFYQKDKEKKTKYPPELEAYQKTATKNSNPVIVEYKIKDQ